MARPRKNAARTQACSLLPPDAAPLPEIPADEQPYPLPADWKWARLGSVATIIMGQSPAGSDTTDDASFMPLVGGASDMGALYPDAKKYTKRPTKISTAHDIIICIRATLGKPIFSNGEYCLGRGVAAIRSASINRIFLRFFLINFEQYLYDHATGSTFAQVSSATLAQMPFPLPPREEQERIVARLESLFARLDEAREKVDAVAECYETRKAALLHKAFSGELTARWRNNHQLSFAAWKNKIFSDIIETSRLGLIRSKSEQGNGHPYKYLKMDNISFGGELLIKNLTSIEATSQEVNLYELKYGDFLFNTRNSFELVGKSAIFNSNERFILFNNNIMRVTFIKNVNSFYINYFFHSPAGRRQLKQFKKNTTNIAAIYAKDLNLMKIPLPTLPEQEEIVRLLDGLLERERRIREAAEQVRERIDLMKKAILARAFRGELG